ncbi:MAG: hypothetical protein IJU16_07230, partial [Clostridia bacterium]|nr:hypothetical protein [Clostridia bacterium]
MKRIVAILSIVACLLCANSCAVVPGRLSDLLDEPIHTTEPTSTSTTSETVIPDDGQFDDCFYYGLLTDEQKENYRAIDAAVKEANEQDLDITAYLPEEEQNGTVYGARVRFPNRVTSEDEVEMLYRVYTYDHPACFYVGGSCYRGFEILGKTWYNEMYIRYYLLQAQRDEAEQELQNAIESLTADLQGGEYSPFDMERLLHDRLAEWCVYDEDAAAVIDRQRLDVSEIDDTVDPCCHTAYGTLCKKLAVCDGYSAAMTLLLDRVGIRSAPAYNDDHAWNLVWIDGEPYHLDVTWDDTENVVRHSYFNLTDDEIYATREKGEITAMPS